MSYFCVWLVGDTDSWYPSNHLWVQRNSKDIQKN